MPAITREQFYIEVTQLTSKRSHCQRAQVGAIIIKDDRIVATGYNGPPSGFAHCEKIASSYLEGYPDEKTKNFCEEVMHYCQGANCTRSIHAETNAIAFAAKAGISIQGAKMYCTLSPCINCAKLIINSGISELCFLNKYRDFKEPLDLLRRSGIVIRHVNNNFSSEEDLK